MKKNLQLNTTSAFAISSEVERINNLILAAELNTPCTFTITDFSKNIINECDSASLRLTSADELQIITNYPILFDQLINNKFKVSICYSIEGVSVYTECFVRAVEFYSNSNVIFISGPFKMDKFQRRGKERVSVPDSFPILLTLSPDYDYLEPLNVINISELGVAANGIIEHDEELFLDAQLYLPNPYCENVFLQLELVHSKVKLGEVIYGFKFINITPKLAKVVASVISTIKKQKI